MSEGCARCSEARRVNHMRRLLDATFDHIVDPLVERILLEQKRLVQIAPHVIYRRLDIVRNRQSNRPLLLLTDDNDDDDEDDIVDDIAGPSLQRRQPQLQQPNRPQRQRRRQQQQQHYDEQQKHHLPRQSRCQEKRPLLQNETRYDTCDDEHDDDKDRAGCVDNENCCTHRHDDYDDHDDDNDNDNDNNHDNDHDYFYLDDEQTDQRDEQRADQRADQRDEQRADQRDGQRDDQRNKRKGEQNFSNVLHRRLVTVTVNHLRQLFLGSTLGRTRNHRTSNSSRSPGSTSNANNCAKTGASIGSGGIAVFTSTASTFSSPPNTTKTTTATTSTTTLSACDTFVEQTLRFLHVNRIISGSNVAARDHTVIANTVAMEHATFAGGFAGGDAGGNGFAGGSAANSSPLEKYTKYLCYVFGDDPDIIRIITSFSSSRHLVANTRNFDSPLFMETGGLFGFNKRTFRVDTPLERSIFEVLQRMQKLDFYQMIVEHLRTQLPNIRYVISTLEKVSSLSVSPLQINKLFHDLLVDFDKLFKQFFYYYFMNLDEATIRSWFAVARSSFDNYEIEVLSLFKNIRESLADCCANRNNSTNGGDNRSGAATTNETNGSHNVAAAVAAAPSASNNKRTLVVAEDCTVGQACSQDDRTPSPPKTRKLH